MDASDQNEIARLRREVEQLRKQLEAQRAPTPVRPDATSLIENYDFVSDMARFADSILSEADIRKKYYLSDEDWEHAGSDDALVRAIEAEKVRRTRNGATARERAQKLFTTTPEILGSILNDDDASARHRIEAAREIRAVAATGPEAQSPTEMFHITINLGDDYRLHIDQPIQPTPGIIKQESLPMIEDNNDDAV